MWAFANALISALTAYLTIKLFTQTDDKKSIWISIIFLLIFPLKEVSSVGWGVGTLNYTWVLAMMLLAVVPIKKIFNNEKIKKYMYPVYLIALIYACNQEQTCVILFLIYLVFLCLQIFQKPRKVSKFLILQFLIIIASLIFIATCPGNYVRAQDEVKNYFMDYNALGFFDKAVLGIVSTVYIAITGKNLVFLAFCIMIAFYVCKNYQNCVYKIISLIPLVFTGIFGIGKDALVGNFPYISIYLKSFDETNLYIFTDDYLDFINYVPLIISLLIIGSIILSLLLIFKKMRNNFALVLFIAGLASRIMMGFSPTIFASVERTFLFFDFALIIDCLLLWQEYVKEKGYDKSIEKLGIFYNFLAIFQYLHTLIFILISA